MAHSAAIRLKVPVVSGPAPSALDFFASAAQLVHRPRLAATDAPDECGHVGRRC
jgi:hypothetical protein